MYLKLFWSFFKIGLFGFGGGYGMISMIQFDVVDKNGWMTNSEFADILALSQMTPGPISINCATYIGYNQGGIIGAIFTTFALCLRSATYFCKYSFKVCHSFLSLRTSVN